MSLDGCSTDHNQSLKTLHLVKLQNVPIFRQLQYEEALIRADDRNWCLLNSGSTDAIVMGISGKPEELINQDLLSVPVIRRFSGGGTVYIDHSTCFLTLICNRRDIGIPPFPKQILNWKGSLLGFDTQENDYVIGSKKFGGNAQYITKNRWLHHTSLLWDYDLEKMQVLKLPPKMPGYRKKRSHQDFLCSLNKKYSNKEQLFDQIIRSLTNHFDIKEATQNDCEECLQRPHRQATRYLSD